MPNPKRQFDKTHLSIDLAEERGIVHRDYIKHCLAWSHVAMRLRSCYKTAKILDIGCGKDVPLARTLYSNKMIPERYVGVDLNKLELPKMLEGKKMPVELHSGNFLEMEFDFTPDVIVSFEVAEHMAPRHCRAYLEKIWSLLGDESMAIISTPCFNGSAALNHINEMTYTALGALLEDIGFGIEDHYGTFASIKDYKHLIEHAGLAETFERLREYYDTNFLSVIFAPLFPEASRNCLWVLRKTRTSERKFPELAKVPEPWSSSPEYGDLDKKAIGYTGGKL